MYLILFPKKQFRKDAFLHDVYEYVVLSNLTCSEIYRLNPSLHFITWKWLAAPRIGSSCRFRLRDPQPCIMNGGRDTDNELSLYKSL